MPTRFDKDTLILILTTPTGFGHIRVADALRRGIVPQSQVVVMGAADKSAQLVHHLFSHALGKRLFEFTQENRPAERLLATAVRSWFGKHPGTVVADIREVVLAQKICPKRVIVMATHPMLALQLAPVKAKLSEVLDAPVTLAMVVTDDSPQEVWAVSGCDVIFVPSNSTRESLLAHLLVSSSVTPEMVTVPYPISPTLGEQLSQTEIRERRRQLAGHQLHVCIPVSGAAVGLTYARSLSEVLLADNHRVTVVTKVSPATADFLSWCQQQQNLTVLSDAENQRVVTLYDDLYASEVIGVEVTKPSEQAFKALCAPTERGGSILLLTAPVGRQEKDNLAFLRRHRLIPSLDDQARLNEWGLNGNRLHITKELMTRAYHWRGIVLPADGYRAGIMIKRLIDAKILSVMGDFRGFLEGHREINSHGVREIWEWVRNESL